MKNSGDCDGPLGLENGNITDGQLSASSEWDWNHGARCGRLNVQKQGGLRGAWSSRRNDGNQWLQVDLFDEDAQVTGIATQGRADWNQWVTKYRLQYAVDGVNFQYYKEQGQSAIKVGTYTLFNTRGCFASRVVFSEPNYIYKTISITTHKSEPFGVH